MAQSESRKSFTFDWPGNYRIRVQGYLDESWSEKLGGMSITTSSGEDQESVQLCLAEWSIRLLWQGY